MKKRIDELDLDILRYLNKGARNSLKKLAEKLNQKTSTIYHRLTRLISNDVILGFTMIFNPELLKKHYIAIIKLEIKPLDINVLDDMFVSSFANYLEEEFDNALFIGFNDSNRTIHMITINFDDNEFNKMITTLKSNAYIKEVDYQIINKIKKGKNLITFNEKWINPENLKLKGKESEASQPLGKRKGKKYSDDLEEINLDDGSDLDDLEEIHF